jgi:hypothetical protein
MISHLLLKDSLTALLHSVSKLDFAIFTLGSADQQVDANCEMSCCQKCWLLWANRAARFCNLLQSCADKGTQLPWELRTQHQLLEQGTVADAGPYGNF